MSTIAKRRNKDGSIARSIQFVINGQRKTLSLPKSYADKDVQEIKLVIDKLIDCIETQNSLDRKLIARLDALPPIVRNKLERLGLIRIRQDLTVKDLWNKYLDVVSQSFKPVTLCNRKTDQRIFEEFFGAETPIKDVTPLRANEYANWLANRYATASKASRIKSAKALFNWALDNELIDSNPFRKVKQGSFQNKTREYYVSMEDYNKLISVCESIRFKALLALYRIGGLRLSEGLRFSFSDVDYAMGKMIVWSDKTARYEGREKRVIPLFKELRTRLMELQQTTNLDSPFKGITQDYIYTHLRKLIETVGLKVWERLIQNLRSSRAIEIAREFGTVCESAWLGHAPTIAQEHYLHVTDDDFARALQEN